MSRDNDAGGRVEPSPLLSYTGVLPTPLPGIYPTTWYERLCGRLTHHRWKRATSRWGRAGDTWHRDEECCICRRGFKFWTTVTPDSESTPQQKNTPDRTQPAEG